MRSRQALAEALELEEKLGHIRARKGLLSFALATMPDFEVNWHHRAIARAMNAMRDGKTPRELLASFGIVGRNLERQLASPHEVTGLYAGMTDPAMVDTPISGLQVAIQPRAGKTEMLSRRAPAWWLGCDPDAQIIACSYAAEIAAQVNLAVQRIIDSEAYAPIFPATQLSGMHGSVKGRNWQRTSHMFEVVGRRGYYKNAGAGGPITGTGATLAICDDLTKNRAEAESAVMRERNWDWYRSTLYTRLEKKAHKALIGTRWHAADVQGKLLDQAKGDPEADQWFCLTFPSVLDCAPGPGDPRKAGEALWPNKYSLRRLAAIRASVGAYEWEALYQQRPSPRGGGIIKDSWWRYYDRIPEGVLTYTLSVDLSFAERGDYSAFTVWAQKDADHYLVDLGHHRVGFTEQIRVFEMLCQKWPKVRAKLVENAANGAALVDALKRKIPGIIPIRPEGSKELRVDAVAPLIEAGNVWLPQPQSAPWVDILIQEFRAFPTGAFDDVVDSTSQYLRWASAKKNYLSGTAPRGDTRASPWVGRGAPL